MRRGALLTGQRFSVLLERGVELAAWILIRLHTNLARGSGLQ
jgi:hypothetical protein